MSNETIEQNLPCDNCGQGVDKHVGPGMPCPTKSTAEILRETTRKLWVRLSLKELGLWKGKP